MIGGNLTLFNVRGFTVLNNKNGVTTIVINDGTFSVAVELIDGAATDLANAIRRSVSQPGQPVTAAEMRATAGNITDTLER